MTALFRSVVALAVFATTVPTLNAADPATVGIVPFDVSGAEGRGTADAGKALSTLVRVEMLKNKDVRPQLLELPAGMKMPLTSKQAAALGQTNSVDYVVVGTVLEASTKRATNSAGSRVLGTVAGSVTRTTATVSLHAELVHAGSGESTTFEVQGNNTDAGVGGTIWTTLGSFGVDDDGWQKTPMGKALREAAQKLTAEVAKTTAKRR